MNVFIYCKETEFNTVSWLHVIDTNISRAIQDRWIKCSAVREANACRYNGGPIEGPPKTPRYHPAMMCKGLHGFPLFGPLSDGFSPDHCIYNLSFF